MCPEPLGVSPDADQSPRLEAQRENDDDAVGDALHLVNAGGQDLFQSAAKQAEENADGFRQEHDEDRAQNRAERRAEPADDENGERLDRQEEGKAFDAAEASLPALLLDTMMLNNPIPPGEETLYTQAVTLAWQSYCAGQEPTHG